MPGFDEKILALYAKGMTTRDIQEIVRELYGVQISATLVSAITEDLDAEVAAWRTRRLDAVWPIIYLDGIVVNVRGANQRVSKHTIYVALGVNLEGKKELLGLLLTAVQNCSAWVVSRRSNFTAHRCVALENWDDGGVSRHLSQIRREAQECTLKWSFGPNCVGAC